MRSHQHKAVFFLNLLLEFQYLGQMPFLIPGIGTQGGDLEKTLLYANDVSKLPYLINASRSIIYASSREDYADQAGIAAKGLRDRINSFRSSL